MRTHIAAQQTSDSSSVARLEFDFVAPSHSRELPFHLCVSRCLVSRIISYEWNSRDRVRISPHFRVVSDDVFSSFSLSSVVVAQFYHTSSGDDGSSNVERRGEAENEKKKKLNDLDYHNKSGFYLIFLLPEFTFFSLLHYFSSGSGSLTHFDEFSQRWDSTFPHCTLLTWRKC